MNLDKPMDDNKNKTSLRLVSLGTNVAVGMGMFILIGYYIDEKRGGQFWTLTGVFLGLVYGGYEVWKAIRN